MLINYILFLNKDEIEIVCNIIPGNVFKELFQKQSKEFSKLKPGFRASSFKADEAVQFAIKNIYTPFISAFINTQIQSWIEEINEFHSQMLETGLDEENAMAKTMAESVFSEHIELYFKLIQKNVDESYLISLKEHFPIDQDKTNDITIPTSKAEDEISLLRDQLDSSTKKIEHYELQIQSLQEEQLTLEQNLAKARKMVQTLQHEKQESDAELADLRARAQFAEDEKTSTAMADSEFEYTSLCEVTPPDYSGQVWLNRLADIDKNGSISVFIADDYIPNFFENRTRLFHKDGPEATGTVAIWNWSAIPSRNDPDRDYVTTSFSPYLSPVEFIVVRDCESTKDLLEKLKTGIKVDLTSSRAIFTVHQSKGQFTGFLCQDQDLDQDGELVKLNKNTTLLPQYNLSSNDYIRLANGKSYLRCIQAGMPNAMVHVKEPMEIVKSVVLSRSSWKTFKESGKTKSDWRNIHDFLENLDISSIVDDIAATANCSHTEAQKMLDDFIEHAGSYIDGTAVENEVISAVIATNSDLMARCKELIADDWIAENQSAAETLKELQSQIEAVRTQQDKEYKAAQERLEALEIKRTSLQKTLQTLTDAISAKEQFAADVETAVAQRIRQAQDHAADFIAGLAFLPKAEVSISGNTSDTHKDETGLSADAHLCYVSGEELEADELEKNETWEDVLETISAELMDAGVTTKLSRPLAAYMYAAYLNKAPLLMIGPNASAITDAFSGAIFGRKAGTLECTDIYSAESVAICCDSEDDIIKILNPFSANWVSKIPDIISNSNKHFIAVYPYSEDIMIEPKSLYNYFLPILTELFVEKAPTGRILGGYLADEFTYFQPEKSNKKHHNKLLTTLHTSMLTKSRIQVLLDNMHTMLKDQDIDYDVLFALLPYAFATMQVPVILDAIQDSEKKTLSVSNDLTELLNGLYGEGV